jgi:hypothetical protein
MFVFRALLEDADMCRVKQEEEEKGALHLKCDVSINTCAIRQVPIFAARRNLCSPSAQMHNGTALDEASESVCAGGCGHAG